MPLRMQGLLYTSHLHHYRRSFATVHPHHAIANCLPSVVNILRKRRVYLRLQYPRQFRWRQHASRRRRPAFLEVKYGDGVGRVRVDPLILGSPHPKDPMLRATSALSHQHREDDLIRRGSRRE